LPVEGSGPVFDPGATMFTGLSPAGAILGIV